MEQPHDYNPNLPSIALGGGGTFGIGAESGYLDYFKEQGADFSGARMIGTSAGSWVASFAATGKTFDEITGKIKNIKVPNRQPGYLQGIAREIFEDERSSNVSAMAVRRPSREQPFPKITMLNGGEHDLADIVAASSSVPRIFAPTRIGNHLYYDGGVRSMGSANLAPKAGKLLAIAALGGSLGENIRLPIKSLKLPIGPVGRLVGPLLDLWFEHEVGQWKKQHGGETVFIRPNREMNKLIKHPIDCFRVDVGKRAYELARIHAERMMTDREDVYDLVNDTRRSAA
jgi:hypothetical protein